MKRLRSTVLVKNSILFNPLRDMGRICPILEKSLRFINTDKNNMRGTFTFRSDVDSMQK